jgi:hypothetical protein
MKKVLNPIFRLQFLKIREQIILKKVKLRIKVHKICLNLIFVYDPSTIKPEKTKKIKKITSGAYMPVLFVLKRTRKL